MPDARTTRRLGPILHGVAVAIGIGFGIVLFGQGMQDVFTIGINDTWATIIGGIAGTLTLLPLSVLGIFRPALASRGMFLSLTVVLFAFFVHYTFYVHPTLEWDDWEMIALWVGPVSVVSVLLLHVSRSKGRESGG